MFHTPENILTTIRGGKNATAFKKKTLMAKMSLVNGSGETKQSKAKGQAGGGMQQPGLVEGAPRLERDGL